MQGYQNLVNNELQCPYSIGHSCRFSVRREGGNHTGRMEVSGSTGYQRQPPVSCGNSLYRLIMCILRWYRNNPFVIDS